MISPMTGCYIFFTVPWEDKVKNISLCAVFVKIIFLISKALNTSKLISYSKFLKVHCS